jgi:Kef-type K+ transport system membrane component KefB
MFKIFWHQEKEKVISQLDTLGIILLVLYIGIEFGRNWIFGYWLSGPTLTAFGLIVLTGLLLGRFLGTLIKIKKVLAEHNI